MTRRAQAGWALFSQALIGCSLGVLFLVLPLWNAAGATATHVVILHSYGRGFEPYNTFSENFRTELAEQFAQPLEFHDVALESARLQGETSERLLVQYLTTLYAGQKLDLVVPVGGPAVRFALRHRNELFPSTPMLFSCVDQRHLDSSPLTANDAVVAVDFDGNFLLKNILQVLPGTTNVAVIVGNSPLERFWRDEMKHEFEPFGNRLNFTWFDELPFSEMLNRAGRLPPHSVIVYVLLSMDAEGIPYTQDQALVQLHDMANAPIFGFHDSQMGHGIVGGPIMEVKQLSQKSVNVALRILHGERPGSIKISVQGQGKPVYDSRELQRWHIDESRLPAGSAILFRQPTPWQLYWRYVVGALSLFGFAAILISLLFLNLVKRRRAERAARESEARLSLATGAANIGIWMRHLSGDQVWVSPNWRRLFGVPADTPIYYQTFLERVHRDDRELVNRAMRHALEYRTDYVAEYRVVLPDGSERWLASRGRLYSQKDGKSEQIGGVAIDITERKLAEAQVRNLQNQLARASRISIMGQLATSIAHELNQPLGAILLNAEAAALLLNQEPLPMGELRATLSDIRKDDQRAGEVIRRMRTLLLQHEFERHPLEVNLLAEEVLRLISGDATSRSIEITTRLSTQLPAIQGDRVHLQQVLLNLIMNAMEAMAHQPPERRRLTVSTSLTTDSEVEITITDSGRGFEPASLPHLFEPFFTTKRSGIGMGLSIADKIVKAHHGRIWAENSPVGGAIFHVILPAMEAKNGDAAEKSAVTDG
jgi:PAS domain S-box-containing protein